MTQQSITTLSFGVCMYVVMVFVQGTSGPLKRARRTLDH